LYPVGLTIRAVLISGREVDAQIVSIETTTLGTFLHIEIRSGSRQRYVQADCRLL
jgi:hypothetical protein